MLLVSQDSMVCGLWTQRRGAEAAWECRKALDHGWQGGEEWCCQQPSMCVCVCARTHTHTHTRTRTHTHTHTSAGARAHTHTHIYINIHTHLYIHAYTYIHTNSHSHLRKASAVPPCPIAPERPTCRLHRSCAHTERGCARVSKIQEASANERGAERMGMIGGVAFRCNDQRSSDTVTDTEQTGTNTHTA